MSSDACMPLFTSSSTHHLPDDVIILPISLPAGLPAIHFFSQLPEKSSSK